MGRFAVSCQQSSLTVEILGNVLLASTKASVLSMPLLRRIGFVIKFEMNIMRNSSMCYDNEKLMYSIKL
jgi:hypothetical protein